jgi:hypothetical protein
LSRYLICLTIGPAFLSAAIYICLGHIVIVYSEDISRLKPRTYTIIFVLCDFLSLVLQAAGGAITSTAEDDQPDLRQTGINIMIAGLASQVASLGIFLCLCADFAWRVYKNPDKLDGSMHHIRKTLKWKAFLIGKLSFTPCFIPLRISHNFRSHRSDISDICPLHLPSGRAARGFRRSLGE